VGYKVRSFAISNQLRALSIARQKLAVSRAAIDEAQRLIDSSVEELKAAEDASVQRGAIRMSLAEASAGLFDATTEIMLCRAFSDTLHTSESGE
jgi:hypothetical protein